LSKIKKRKHTVVHKEFAKQLENMRDKINRDFGTHLSLVDVTENLKLEKTQIIPIKLDKKKLRKFK